VSDTFFLFYAKNPENLKVKNQHAIKEQKQTVLDANAYIEEALQLDATGDYRSSCECNKSTIRLNVTAILQTDYWE
jgi:hypothetical protein